MDDQKRQTDEFVAALLEDQNRGVLATLWLRLTAQLGSADAQVAIGRTLMYGSGVPADNEAAAKWLRRAALSGHPHAGRYLEIIANNAGSLEGAKN